MVIITALAPPPPNPQCPDQLHYPGLSSVNVSDLSQPQPPVSRPDSEPFPTPQVRTGVLPNLEEKQSLLSNHYVHTGYHEMRTHRRDSVHVLGVTRAVVLEICSRRRFISRCQLIKEKVRITLLV